MKPRAIRAAKFIAAALALVVLGYPLAAWVGSSIPDGRAMAAPADVAETVEIMVETNGTHTGIIVPIVTSTKDWRETFPSASMPRPDGLMPTHLAIGWGEREVFLEVLTWGDLKPSTALRIATVGGDPIMRVSHYVRPRADENFRPVRISVAQYERLVAAIDGALPSLPEGQTREILRGTFAADAYYEAHGSYTMTNTCNTWVGDTLAEAGVEMGIWTPLAGGVMKWIPEPDETV
ncbi:hypothetical protein AAW01_01360 [Aurantiacibacter gangjinensis]|uniref:DUF2459 domain-containing protein n=1 Tax=Aurantiacibacter gangjinensis TaxID=502682 RepID=A0A0G9MWE2_9SPHN|nr:hypothetical protein AAW01_01360 [Aurantiacibacter gangjinensis]